VMVFARIAGTSDLVDDISCRAIFIVPVEAVQDANQVERAAPQIIGGIRGGRID